MPLILRIMIKTTVWVLVFISEAILLTTRTNQGVLVKLRSSSLSARAGLSALSEILYEEPNGLGAPSSGLGAVGAMLGPALLTTLRF